MNKELNLKMIADISNEHSEWFSKDWRVLNERAILFQKGGFSSTKRPDRVIVKERQAIIIDYKTAQDVAKKEADGSFTIPKENRDQLEDYRQHLIQMGYTDVKAFLWYILDRIIVPV